MSTIRSSATSTDAPGHRDLEDTPNLPALPFTGERMVPGKVPESLFREHEARYVFAGRFVKDKIVLDVACGTGTGTYFLLKAGAQKCLGLDIDVATIEEARAVYRGCHFDTSDATNLSVPDASIDVVVSFETIEHIHGQLKFLQECHRVLKPGGVLICSTPNRTMSRWLAANPFHIHEFTAREFDKTLATMFVNVKLYGQTITNLFLYAFRSLASRALYALHLMGFVKRILRRKGVPEQFVSNEFSDSASDPVNEVRPYQHSMVLQPRYVIAVAYKSL